MDNSVENQKSMLRTLLSFIIFLLLMCLLQYKYVFAEESKIYYVEDLVNGTILKPGDMLYVYQDYHHDSSGTGYYQNDINIYYTKAEEDREGQYDYGTSVKIDSKKYFTIPSYNDVFKLNSDYSTWILTIDNYYIRLNPSNEKTLPDRELPNKDNSYMLENQLNNFRNNYYLLTTIKNDAIKNDGWSISPRGEYYFNNYNRLSLDSKLTLEFEFEAEKGQFLYFDYRSFLGGEGNPKHNIYTAKLNDIEIDITDISRFYTSSYNGNEYYGYYAFPYRHMLVPIKTSGKQKFVIEYQVIDENNSRDYYDYNYGYIRNVSLLTYINSGYKLDTSKLNDGDTIVYLENDEYGSISLISDSFTFEEDKVEEKNEARCYTCDAELIWTDNPNSGCTIRDDITSQGMCVSNPKTGVTSALLITLIVVSAAILGIVVYNRMNRFSKI